MEHRIPSESATADGSAAVPGGPARACPYCLALVARPAHPYRSRFDGSQFRYWRCRACDLVYIDPLPTPAMFERMYAAGDYHETFYEGDGQGAYDITALRLARHLPEGASVLDFGCGGGHLLAALKRHGFRASGVEFTKAAAERAAARSGADVFDIGEETWRTGGPWDCVHFGDVIEHLPNPRATLEACLSSIAPGGLLSAEGPLEANRSLVYAATRAYAAIKRWRQPGYVAEFPPYHLIFANERSQRAFFAGFPALRECAWAVTESGWPYRGNGFARDAIARAAILLSRLPLAFGRFGNRFAAIYRVTAGDRRASG